MKVQVLVLVLQGKGFLFGWGGVGLFFVLMWEVLQGELNHLVVNEHHCTVVHLGIEVICSPLLE